MRPGAAAYSPVVNDHARGPNDAKMYAPEISRLGRRPRSHESTYTSAALVIATTAALTPEPADDRGQGRREEHRNDRHGECGVEGTKRSIRELSAPTSGYGWTSAYTSAWDWSASCVVAR
jgi:hypothetical protein